MTIKTVHIFKQQDLRNLIADLIGIDRKLVIAANSQIDTTNLPFYVTVYDLSSTTDGISRKMDDKQEIEYVETVLTKTYSIQIIGKNSDAWAERLRASLRLGRALRALRRINLGILSMSSTRDVTMAIDSGYESRTQFDLVTSQTAIVSDEQYAILSAEIDLIVEQ